MRSLQHATVLIAGAGRGVGKRLAIGFAQHGARVGLLGRSQGELDVTKLEIEHGGGSAHRFRADIADYEQVSAAVDRMGVTWGSVQVLIASAAVQGPIGPFAEQKPREWREVFDTNILGTLNCCRAVLPQMIQRRSGKIIVLSGSGATEARPGFAAFSASKSAIVRFVETVAMEVRDDNVQINCMFPGESYTNMTDEILQAGHRAGAAEIEAAEKVRLTGGVSPDKQIQLALFLASQQSNHVSGKLIHIGDDWKRLEHENARPEAFTLRRHLR